MIKASCSGKMERGLKRASELLLEMCKFIKAKLTYHYPERTVFSGGQTKLTTYYKYHVTVPLPSKPYCI